MSQAFWKGECWLKCEIVLPSKWFEGVYQNHWAFATWYLRAISPCSHHSRTIGRPIVANSVVHFEGRGSRLHLPLDGWVGGDHNQKYIHEGKFLHLSIQSQWHTPKLLGRLKCESQNGNIRS
jgi:hypothetical protein